MSTPTTSRAALAPNPFALWKVDHAAVRVPDFDAAVAWYTEKLDFRMKQSWLRGEMTFAYMSPAADDGFSFELLAGPGADSRPHYDDLNGSFRLSGWHHICLRVDSIQDTVDELKRRGVKIVSEPHDVAAIQSRLAFFADPWGNLFEVLQSLGD
jgi:catechol 2,3-dioxygenase-like lactoylglutathione lyase family enzyme